MSYLHLSRLRVRAANALAGNYAINAAPVMAIVLFVHNLGLKTGCRPRRVAILHHDGQLLGEFGSDGFYDFHPQQRRGATFIDATDYSSKNPHALSLQPTASCHLVISLLIEVDGPANKKKVERFLQSARIAGGSVDEVGAVDVQDDPDALRLRNGFWLIERSDLMATHDHPVDALVAAIGSRATRSKAEPEDSPTLPTSWLAATVLGYAAITPFARREGVRMTGTHPDDDGGHPLHAYSEPLLGLVQYVSRRDYGPRPIPFWEHTWLQDDVFVVRQTQTS